MYVQGMDTWRYYSKYVLGGRYYSLFSGYVRTAAGGRLHHHAIPQPCQRRPCAYIHIMSGTNQLLLSSLPKHSAPYIFAPLDFLFTAPVFFLLPVASASPSVKVPVSIALLPYLLECYSGLARWHLTAPPRLLGHRRCSCFYDKKYTF